MIEKKATENTRAKHTKNPPAIKLRLKMLTVRTDEDFRHAKFIFEEDLVFAEVDRFVASP